MQTWEPTSNNSIPDFPQELQDRPDVIWLYACKSAGLSIDDMKQITIDQAEAYIEAAQFVNHAVYSDGKPDEAKRGEAAFWGN